MKAAFLKTLAAGILTGVCLTGMPESASAQFFDDDRMTAPNRQSRAPQYGDVYDRELPHQWQDRGRIDQRRDQRYIRTNTTDESLPRDEYRSRRGRCSDGQCKQNRGDRVMEDGTTFYRGRRSRGDSMADGRGYRPRRAMTTGWDPSHPDAIDPATGWTMERSYQDGHGHADGQSHRGHGRCRDCVNGQCDCPDGQCTCPAGSHDCKDGQCRPRQFDSRTAPADSNLTRRNMGPQYMPTRSPYRN